MKQYLWTSLYSSMLVVLGLVYANRGLKIK